MSWRAGSGQQGEVGVTGEGQVLYDTAGPRGPRGHVTESEVSNLGALGSAGLRLREPRRPCSHPWSQRTGPRRSPLGRGAAFPLSAWPPWVSSSWQGEHPGSRCPHPRPGRPTPQSYLLSSSSVSPESSAPLSRPSASSNSSAGLFPGTSSNSPPRMAPKSTVRYLSCPLSPAVPPPLLHLTRPSPSDPEI